MRQVWVTGFGPPGRLVLREAPDPAPQDDQLRVRVAASGINFADVMARQGIYPDAPPVPFVVGYEVAGLVDAVGPKARPDWVGKRVFGLVRFGGYADTVLLPEGQAWEAPAALDDGQCAALPVQYLTAWQLLVVMGSLHEGESVLIHNAGGGLGLAAIDIARHAGATIYGTASARKHEFLRARGVHHPIDYATLDWRAELMRLTEGQGVELVIDPIGGSSWKKSFSVLRHTGRLGMFGASMAAGSKLPRPLRMLRLGVGMPFFHPLSLMNANRGVFGVNIGHLWHEGPKLRGWMQALLEGVAAGWVRPHVDRSFPLAAAAEAHAYIEGRGNRGKVVLVP